MESDTVMPVIEKMVSQLIAHIEHKEKFELIAINPGVHLQYHEAKQRLPCFVSLQQPSKTPSH